jgi:hypothetical protein
MSCMRREVWKICQVSVYATVESENLTATGYVATNILRRNQRTIVGTQTLGVYL